MKATSLDGIIERVAKENGYSIHQASYRKAADHPL